MLPDIAHHPRILTNYVTVIQPASFKKVSVLYGIFHHIITHYNIMQQIGSWKFIIVLLGLWGMYKYIA